MISSLAVWQLTGIAVLVIAAVAILASMIYSAFSQRSWAATITAGVTAGCAGFLAHVLVLNF